MEALIVLLLSLAQVYTVNPDGSGDFDNLQTALDTVPDRATLLVQDWHQAAYGVPAFLITKSVTLNGQSLGGEYTGTLTSPILIVAPQCDVLIEGMQIGGDGF